MNRLERLYAVTEEIRRRAPGAVSAAWLAEHFGVARRTIERDLASLRLAGVPLDASQGRRGGYALDPRFGRAAITLSAAEATALLLALSAANGMPYGQAARSATRRLAEVLPAATRVQIEQLRQRLRTVPANPPQASPRVQATVEEAVRLGSVVKVTYVDGAGQRTTRDVEAVGFYGSHDGWYLIGWCRLRQAGRIFRLDRIQRATLTAEIAPYRDIDETLGWVPEPTLTPE